MVELASSTGTCLYYTVTLARLVAHLNNNLNRRGARRTGIRAPVGANLGLGAASSGLTWGVVLVSIGFLIFGATAVMVLSKWPIEKGTARRAEALLQRTGLATAGGPAHQDAQSMITALTWYYVGALGSILGIWFS